ncbi:MAG TPA: hypothetical protein VGL13_01610 [Polyangiaceae bacterium]
MAPVISTAGVSAESAIDAENNVFKADNAFDPARLISRFNGTLLFETGTQIDGECDAAAPTAFAAWNAVNDPDLSAEVGCTPVFFTEVEPTRKVWARVREGAGPMAW